MQDSLLCKSSQIEALRVCNGTQSMEEGGFLRLLFLCWPVEESGLQDNIINPGRSNLQLSVILFPHMTRVQVECGD